MQRINPELTKAIQDQLANNPKLDEEALTDLITQIKPPLRLRREVILAGVKEYYRKRDLLNKAKEDKQAVNNTNHGIDQPKKKLKRSIGSSEFDPRFIDQP